MGHFAAHRLCSLTIFAHGAHTQRVRLLPALIVSPPSTAL
jgi:hypothetical protein